MKQYLVRSLRELLAKSPEQLVDGRYAKFRKMGVFLDEPSAPDSGTGERADQGEREA